MTSRLLEVPIVVIGQNDATWLVDVLVDLGQNGGFDRFPGINDRARALVDDLLVVANHGHGAANSGQTVATRGATDESGCVTYKQAGVHLGKSERSVRRYVQSGRLPVVRVGGTPRIRAVDLDALIKEG